MASNIVDPDIVEETQEDELLVKFEMLKQLARTRFIAFFELICGADPTYIISKFHRYIATIFDESELPDGSKRITLSVPPQHGKSLDIFEIIMTPDGEKHMGDLKVGDHVFAPDGSPTEVIATKLWKNEPLYRVTCDDGSSVVAGENHDWSVCVDRKRPDVYTKHDTKWLHERFLAGRRAVKLPAVHLVQYPEKELPYDPYVVGAWLGNGTRASRLISCNGFDADHFVEHSNGLIKFIEMEQDKNCAKLRINDMSFMNWARANGLNKDKYIPDIYLKGSVAQRRRLLHGLMDTDGHCAKDGQCEYCSMEKPLADGVLELIHSLGIKGRILTGRATLNGKDYGEKYRVVFYGTDVFSSPRKKQFEREVKESHRYIVSCEPVGRGDAVCIEVAHPSHLFLCSPYFIPTHNSKLTTRFVAWYVATHPDKSVAWTGFSEPLLRRFLVEVMDIVESPLFQEIFPGFSVLKNQNQSLFKKFNNGSCILVKPSGSKLTGSPANLLIVDDPHPGRAEVESDTLRKAVHTWYEADCVSRLAPESSIIIIATRWHPDDLIGHITSDEANQKLEVEGLESDKFRKIELSAIAEEGVDDPIGRSPGEALFPEWRNIKFLRLQKASIPPYEFESQFQQHPVITGSGNASLENIKFIMPSEISELTFKDMMSAWDIAASEKQKNDYTVGVLGASDADGNFYILDVIRRRLVWPKMKTVAAYKVLDWLRDYGCASLAAEGVSGFKTAVDDMREILLGQVRVRLMNPRRGKNGITGSKLFRAMPWLNALEAGKLFMVRAPWNAELLEELRTFPAGSHDDQADAISILHDCLFSKRKLRMAIV